MLHNTAVALARISSGTQTNKALHPAGRTPISYQYPPARQLRTTNRYPLLSMLLQDKYRPPRNTSTRNSRATGNDCWYRHNMKQPTRSIFCRHATLALAAQVDCMRTESPNTAAQQACKRETCIHVPTGQHKSFLAP